MIRSAFLCLFAACLTGFQYQEEIPDTGLVDSLKSRLAVSVDDSERAGLYYRILDHFYYLNQDSAVYYTKLYLNAAREMQDTVWIAWGHYWLTDLYYHRDLDSALTYADRYIKSSLKLDDPEWIADAYDYKAYICDMKGKLTEALENFQQALRFYQAAGDSFSIAACYNNIGYILSYGMDQPASLRYLLRALEFAKQIGDSALLADANTNIAYYYEAINEYETARSYYQRALDLSSGQKDKDSLFLAMSLASLAHADIQLDKHDHAARLLFESKNMIPGLPDPYYLSLLYSGYADCYLQWNAPDSARKYINKQAVMLENSDYDILLAHLMLQQGVLMLKMGEYHRCLKLLDKATAFYTELDYKEGLKEIHSNKAEAYSKLKMDREAFSSLKTANAYRDSLKYGVIAKMLSKQEQEQYYQAELRAMKLEMELEQQKIEADRLRTKTNLKVAILAVILLFVFVAYISWSLYRLRGKNKELAHSNRLISNQQEQLEKQISRIRENENKLRELNATKDKFFSIIAHDLKGPLTSIIGLTDLMLADEGLIHSDRFMPVVESMNQTASYGFNLLENLLEWSLSQTGRLTVKPQPLMVEELVQQVSNDLNGMAGRKNVSIEIHSDNDTPVYADKNMVLTILRNLIHNAIKYSHQDSIIRIETEVLADVLEVSIEDQGIGMSEDELAKVFNMDKQVRKTGTSQEKGTGLGLLLCKEFAEKNKGSIKAKGKKGTGCTFMVTLPCHSPGP